jgi:hypothetical protein
VGQLHREVVPPQVNLRHLRIRGLIPAGYRRSSISAWPLSPFFRVVVPGNQTDDDFEGLPSPILAGEGEQAVFNLVPLLTDNNP